MSRALAPRGDWDTQAAHAFAARLRRIDDRVTVDIVNGPCPHACGPCQEELGVALITWWPVDDLRDDRAWVGEKCVDHWMRDWVLPAIGDPDVVRSLIDCWVCTAVAVPRGDAA